MGQRGGPLASAASRSGPSESEPCQYIMVMSTLNDACSTIAHDPLPPHSAPQTHTATGMPSGNPMTGSATDGDDIELDMGGADLLQRPAVLCCGMAPLRLAFVVSAVSCVVCAVFLVVGLVIFAVLGSSATLGFALENGVDLVGSLFMLWRFWGGGKGVAAETLELREKRSSMAIALMFAILVSRNRRLLRAAVAVFRCRYRRRRRRR